MQCMNLGTYLYAKYYFILAYIKSTQNLLWGIMSRTNDLGNSTINIIRCIPSLNPAVSKHSISIGRNFVLSNYLFVTSYCTEKWLSLVMIPIWQELLPRKHLFLVCLEKGKKPSGSLAGTPNEKDFSLSKCWHHEVNPCKTKDTGMEKKNCQAAELDT